MHIRITKAQGFKKVRIDGEEVNVGEPTYVSDSFTRRLSEQFPSFEYEELADGEDAPITDGNEKDGGGALAGDVNDDENKGGDA